MRHVLHPNPLTSEAFAPFGDVLEAKGPPDMRINQDLCGRFHDRAKIDIADGRTGISIFKSDARRYPVELNMVERHPMGSQAFLPMTADPFLVVVAKDINGAPDVPQVFLSAAGQGVNYHRNVWHGVLTPLSEPGLFAVIDRIGAGRNLEEHWFDAPYEIHPSQ
ncbi:MAG: ureidoglycolate lyase [Pseudomonadota bacterium]